MASAPHPYPDHPPVPDLAGRPAVVTGGASGIGHAIARRLAQAGSKVIVVDHDNGKLEKARRSFEHVFATNLRGPWFFTKRLTEELIRRREPGSVLFISSRTRWR